MAEMAGNKDGRAEGILGESDAHTSLDARHGSQDSDMYEESIDSSDYDAPHARPYLTRLRLALAPYTVHFRNPGYIRDETLRMLERDVVKKTLEDSRKRLELREELGLAWEFWDDLAGVLKAAIPSLEKRCFAQPDPAAPEYEGLSGPLIASYSPSLLRDLERLNQLVCITRNVLVHGERVQNLSAERLFDKDIFMYKPEVFYSFAKDIYPSNFKPSASHRFIRLLEERGQLLRNYTQNIDTLEQAAGIKSVLNCHGSFATVS